MIGYFWDDFVPKAFFDIRTATQAKNFTTITKRTKNTSIRYYSNWLIRKNTGGKLYYLLIGMALHSVLSYQTAFYESKVDHLLVPKFFHEKANETFVEKFKLVRKIDPQISISSEVKNIGRVLYLYKSESLTVVHTIYHNSLDWPFPDKYSDK